MKPSNTCRAIMELPLLGPLAASAYYCPDRQYTSAQVLSVSSGAQSDLIASHQVRIDGSLSVPWGRIDSLGRVQGGEVSITRGKE